MKQPPQIKTSQIIKAFCNFVDSAQKDYTWNSEEIAKLDKLTQDYLHMLELGSLNYKERAKVATKLAECRKLRRMSKDTVEVLQAIIDLISSEKGKSMMNMLREALGKTRKAEDWHGERTYRFKVLEENKFG